MTRLLGLSSQDGQMLLERMEASKVPANEVFYNTYMDLVAKSAARG